MHAYMQMHSHTHIHTLKQQSTKKNPKSHGYCNCQAATGGIYALLILILWLKMSFFLSQLYHVNHFSSFSFHFSSLLFPRWQKQWPSFREKQSPAAAGRPAEQLSLLQNLWVSYNIVKSLRSAHTSPKRYSRAKNRNKLPLPHMILLLSLEASGRKRSRGVKEGGIGEKKRRKREVGGGEWEVSPLGYTCQNPLLCVSDFFSNEQQFSLTKHFPAYLQTEGGDGAQVGTWETERM